MKQISVYEAAVLYDFSKNVSAFPSFFLVFDLDHGAAGLCECTETGKTNLIKETETDGEADLWTNGIEQICKKINADPGDNIINEIENGIQELNQKMEGYYMSGKTRNEVVFSSGQITFTASDFESGFSDQNPLFRHLIQRAGELAALSSTDPEEMHFILLGKAARLLAVEYAFREYFSADPLLPDDRFVNSDYDDGPETIAELGMKYYRSRNRVGHTISILTLDSEGNRRQAQVLVSEEQERSDLMNASWFGPVFAADGGSIELIIDGNARSVEIPHSMDLTDDHLIEFTVGFEGEKLSLLIRKTDDNSQKSSVVLG